MFQFFVSVNVFAFQRVVNFKRLFLENQKTKLPGGGGHFE